MNVERAVHITGGLKVFYSFVFNFMGRFLSKHNALLNTVAN
jgi:hypothetical protein